MKSLSSNKSLKNRRNTLLFVIIVAVLLASVGVGYFFIKSSQEEQGKQEALKQDQDNSKTNKNAKRDSIKNSESNNSNSGLPQNSTSTTTEEIPSDSSLSVNITSTSQTNTVNAIAKTSGDGTCIFQYNPGDGGMPVISPGITVANKVCEYSRSQNDFTFLGPWKLKVVYYSDESKVEDTKDVTIN